MNASVLIEEGRETLMLVGVAPEKVAVPIGTCVFGDQLPAVFQLLPGPAQVASCE
ncbi:hypothetical protein Q3C01_10145 [Bradyrhizobium sp. UFLA05-109]